MVTITAQKENLNVKVDSDLKQKAGIAFKQMGLNTSVAINMFLRRVVDDGQLPFTPRFNKETLSAFEDAKAGRTVSFDSVDDLMRDLADED